MTKQEFINVFKIVIDNFEGGYYHPSMLEDGRLVINDAELLKLYKKSGETMYGLDRKNGEELNTTTEGVAFWQVIDFNNASQNWKFNYKGGNLSDTLSQLLATIMYKQFLKLFTKYASTELQKIAKTDKRIILHLGYATWNGSGYFQKFSKILNKAIENGTRNVDKLADICIKSRLQDSAKTIRLSGQKMEKLFNKIKSPSKYIFKKILLGSGGLLTAYGLFRILTR